MIAGGRRHGVTADDATGDHLALRIDHFEAGTQRRGERLVEAGCILGVEESAAAQVRPALERRRQFLVIEREAYDAFVDKVQARVTGTVSLRLNKGNVVIAGRESENALYDERFVTFGEDDVYEQSDAAGFIRLFGLPARVRALKDQQLAASERASRTNVAAR